MDNFVSQKGKDYITAVKGLKKEESEKGTGWLQGIVDNINSLVREILPT